jgi:putative transposon-encoded protein
MPRIKITEKETEIDGALFESSVKPFGTSAHIPFTKQQMGKKVKIIVPTETEYVWVFNSTFTKEVIKIATDYILQQNGKLEHYNKEIIENIKNENITQDDLIKFIQILINADAMKQAERIKEMYQL